MAKKLNQFEKDLKKDIENVFMTHGAFLEIVSLNQEEDEVHIKGGKDDQIDFIIQDLALWKD